MSKYSHENNVWRFDWSVKRSKLGSNYGSTESRPTLNHREVPRCSRWNARTGSAWCSYASGNPKGIESISPALRGTSYPGGKTAKSQTLKGFHLLHKSLICNPFRVVTFLVATQRRPSLNRANAGLSDAIPLGLLNRPVPPVWKPLFHIPPKTAKNQNVKIMTKTDNFFCSPASKQI